MRSVGIGFCILVARIALIVFFDSLADQAVGVAAVAALLAGLIWLLNERRPAMAAIAPVTWSTIPSATCSMQSHQKTETLQAQLLA